MKRRTILAGLGATALGGSALLGSGAFSRVDAQRDVTIQVATDENAYLGMKPLDTPNSNNFVELDDDGHLTIDVGEHSDAADENRDVTEPAQGVNSDSFTFFDGMFDLCNQGKEAACLSYDLPEAPDARAYGDDFIAPDPDYDQQVITFYYISEGGDDPGQAGDRIMIQEGQSVPLPLGECKEIGLRTVTKGVDATLDAPLVEGEAVVTADVDGDCFEQEPCTPECPSPTNPDPGTDDFDVTIENIDASTFPTVKVTTRVDTTAGGNGNIPDGNFSIDESTPNGIGTGFCGQTIESVTFGGQQQETFADVMFVIDTSGSMSGDKIENAREGAISLVGGDTDTNNDATQGGFDPTVDVGLTEYDSSATTPAPLGTGQNTVEDEMANLTGFGGTSLGAGIREANEQFFVDPNGLPPDFALGPNNRSGVPDFMIVLGNGDTSGGKDPADDAKNNGVTIFGIAYGSGASVSDFSEVSGEEPSDPDYQDYTFDADTDDITDIFDRIGEEIFGTYTIEYETANCEEDGLDRNVKVYVDDPNAGDADDTGSYIA